jgi:hypothetical protein
MKTIKEQGVRARSLARSTLGVEGRVGAPGWDYENWQALTHSHKPAQNQTTSWLVHSWSTFGARTIHGQTRTHKTHHGLDLGEATTFPLIVYYVPLYEAHIQMAFYQKLAKLGLSQLWSPITLRIDLQLRWSLKQNYSLVEKFPMVCHTPLAHKEIGSILDF